MSIVAEARLSPAQRLVLRITPPDGGYTGTAPHAVTVVAVDDAGESRTGATPAGGTTDTIEVGPWRRGRIIAWNVTVRDASNATVATLAGGPVTVAGGVYSPAAIVRQAVFDILDAADLTTMGYAASILHDQWRRPSVALHDVPYRDTQLVVEVGVARVARSSRVSNPRWALSVAVPVRILSLGIEGDIALEACSELAWRASQAVDAVPNMGLGHLAVHNGTQQWTANEPDIAAVEGLTVPLAVMECELEVPVTWVTG